MSPKSLSNNKCLLIENIELIDTLFILFLSVRNITIYQTNNLMVTAKVLTLANYSNVQSGAIT